MSRTRRYDYIEPLQIENDGIMNILLYEHHPLPKIGLPLVGGRDGFLNELNLPYEIKNVTSQPQYAKELEEKSGQCKSPTLDLDGKLLSDASVKDVAKALGKRGVVI